MGSWTNESRARGHVTNPRSPGHCVEQLQRPRQEAGGLEEAAPRRPVQSLGQVQRDVGAGLGQPGRQHLGYSPLKYLLGLFNLDSISDREGAL